MFFLEHFQRDSNRNSFYFHTAKMKIPQLGQVILIMSKQESPGRE